MKNYKVNQKVRITANPQSIHPGDGVVTLPNPGTGLVQVRMTSGPNTGGTYNIYTASVKPVVLSKKELQAEAKDLENELSEVRDRMAWMDEAKTEEYDEDEFKAWRALSALDSDLSKLEKVKILAKLMKA